MTALVQPWCEAAIVEAMATAPRHAHRPRWALAFLAVLVAALTSVVGVAPAPATTGFVSQNGVGASTSAAPVVVGPDAGITAGQRLGNDPPQAGIVVATGVAANTGGDAQALLASIGQEGKTAGVLDIGGELTPLVSGKSPLGNYAASGHVEGQAALIMRERGVSTAELLIDNANGICGYCTSQVPTLLPEGAQLSVRTPLGTVPPSSRWFNGRTFSGNAADPKAWP